MIERQQIFKQLLALLYHTQSDNTVLNIFLNDIGKTRKANKTYYYKTDILLDYCATNLKQIMTPSKKYGITSRLRFCTSSYF